MEPIPVRVEEKVVEDTFMAAYKAAAEITKQRREAEAPIFFGKSEQAVAKRKDETELRERFGKRTRIEGRRAVGSEGGRRTGGIEESEGVGGVAIDATLAPKSTDIRARAARAAALLAKREGDTSVEGRKEGSLWVRVCGRGGRQCCNVVLFS